MELPSALLDTSSKNKKINPEKNSLCFRKWNSLTLRLKNFLYFLKRKLFLYFRKQNFLIFQETETPKKIAYSSGNRFFIFQEMKTPKKFFIFQETEHFYISGNKNSE